MLATHDYPNGVFVGHSYGTSWLSYVCKYATNAVAAILFLDPICFCLHTPRLTKNFVYHTPDPGTISYVVRTDMMVNWTIQVSGLYLFQASIVEPTLQLNDYVLCIGKILHSVRFHGFGLPCLLNRFRSLVLCSSVIRMPLSLPNEWKTISNRKAYQYAMPDRLKESFLIRVATSTPACFAGVFMETLQTIRTCCLQSPKLAIAFVVGLRIRGRFLDHDIATDNIPTQTTIANSLQQRVIIFGRCGTTWISVRPQLFVSYYYPSNFATRFSRSFCFLIMASLPSLIS